VNHREIPNLPRHLVMAGSNQWSFIALGTHTTKIQNRLAARIEPPGVRPRIVSSYGRHPSAHPDRWAFQQTKFLFPIR